MVYFVPRVCVTTSSSSSENDVADGDVNLDCVVAVAAVTGDVSDDDEVIREGAIDVNLDVIDGAALEYPLALELEEDIGSMTIFTFIPSSCSIALAR